MFDERVSLVAGEKMMIENTLVPCVCAWRGRGKTGSDFNVCVFQVRRDHQPVSVEDSTAWRASYTPQIWKPEVCVFV